jgi:hypothetical protein
MSFLWPTGSTSQPRISDGYGPREDVGDLGTLPFHHGVDIPMGRGTPVRAAYDGEVIFSGWFIGETVVVRSIVDGSTVDFIYPHMESGSRILGGAQVRQGQPVGTCGTTGQSTGPHVCFRIIVDGNWRTYAGSQNPVSFMNEHNAASYLAGRPAAPIQEDDMYGAPERAEVVGRLDQIALVLQTLVGRSRGLTAFRSDPNLEFQGKRGAGEIFIAAPGIWFHAPPAYWALARARGVVDEPINIGWNEVPFWRDVIYLGAERDDQEVLAILRDQFPETAATAITSKIAASE